MANILPLQALLAPSYETKGGPRFCHWQQGTFSRRLTIQGKQGVGTFSASIPSRVNIYIEQTPIFMLHMGYLLNLFRDL